MTNCNDNYRNMGKLLRDICISLVLKYKIYKARLIKNCIMMGVVNLFMI